MFVGFVLKEPGSTSYLYFACCLQEVNQQHRFLLHGTLAPMTPLLWWTETHYLCQNGQCLVRCLDHSNKTEESNGYILFCIY